MHFFAPKMKYFPILICLCKTPEDVRSEEKDTNLPGVNFNGATDVMQVIILQRCPFLLNAFYIGFLLFCHIENNLALLANLKIHVVSNAQLVRNYCVLAGKRPLKNYNKNQKLPLFGCGRIH